MIPHVFLMRPNLAASYLKGTVHGSQWAAFLVLGQIRSTYPFGPTAVGTLHGEVNTDLVVLVGHSFEGILVTAVLATDLTILALLHQMFPHILTWEGVPTLVGAGTDGVTTPWVPCEVSFHPIHLPHPLAPLLVVRTVYLQGVDTLLKVHITEVVKALCFAGRAGVIDIDPLLYAALAIVCSTAHHLSGVTQHLGTKLAHQFFGHLPDKIV